MEGVLEIAPWTSTRPTETISDQILPDCQILMGFRGQHLHYLEALISSNCLGLASVEILLMKTIGQ